VTLTPEVVADPAATDRSQDVTAVVAARDEEDRIGHTVRALRSIPEVGRVVVADDGSGDSTATMAEQAGALVLRLPRPVGKGGAVEAALSGHGPASVYLLADGDLGTSAIHLRALLAPVFGGDADLAVGVLPSPPIGGFGLVKRAAAGAVDRLSGYRPREPLSGQRAITHACLEACRPLAAGFGLEAAMLADAARLGFRIVEVAVDVEHRFTGRDVAGFLHRARQGVHIARAVAPRMAGWR
jgi:glycosyltransferase involved in cell wall biosynthesis